MYFKTFNTILDKILGPNFNDKPPRHDRNNDRSVCF